MLPMVWDMISLIIYVVLGTLLFIVLIYLIARTVKFNSYKFNPVVSQRGEFINNNIFKTKDGFELKINGAINKNNDPLLLCVPDFHSTYEEFDNLYKYISNNKLKYDFISFDQRGVKNQHDLEQNQGTLLSDVKEMIESIKERYQDKEIILISSGFNLAVLSKILHDNTISQMVALNLRVNKAYKNSKSFNFTVFFGTLFNMNLKVIEKLHGEDMVEGKNEIDLITKNNLQYGSFSVRQYFQNKKAVKYLAKNINKAPVKVTIFQPTDDLYCNRKKTAKFLTKFDKNKYNLVVLKNKKHKWFMENDVKSFELLFKSI
ncbi:serine aminopeptidase domain-containing protein [Spiroplasma culicicola]|uniref:Serine aminopeptidase S33 domain-containing protein n=1 Tax=Spiroplasma culicicola AES-1 TaxID=1276246 RepID=W6A8E3_9MOLU|nr:alpha/beta hydrolase [Spiroplasma culicicola]AHI53160.1 hypothetical protein SCULI_v1c08200 [Spiroplasma culicicola AES-1]